MSAGVVGLEQELEQRHKGACSASLSRFLRATYFFTLLCWINKMRWCFCNERVQTHPSVLGRLLAAGAGRVLSGDTRGRGAPCPPQPLLLKPRCSHSRWVAGPAGLARQPSSWAEAPVRALLVPVSLWGRCWCALLGCTSSFPKGLSWLLVKWLSCLSCVIT